MNTIAPDTRVTVICVSLTALLVLAAASQTAAGFSLLGFYSIDNARRWSNNYAPFMEGGLTYSFDDEFANGFFGCNPQYKIAVEDALRTWEQGGTNLYFGRAAYNGVAVDDSSGILEAFLTGNIEGPGPDGLGANIDFFSRPDDFSYTLWGQTRSLSGKLAMAEVITSGAEILSVDIYFNQDYNYTTHGGGGLDIESVALHEIGHAIGLDHPEQSYIQVGGEWEWRNYNPTTYEVEPYESGWQGSVMWHDYQGIRRELQLEDTGGATFLYGEEAPPPAPVGCIINNLILENIESYPLEFHNQSGIFDLNNPESDHCPLAYALAQSGIPSHECAYFLNIEGTPAMFTAYVLPYEPDVIISFDISLICGNRIDESAFVVLETAGIEVFRMDFDDFYISEMVHFELQDGYEYRTDYMSIEIPLNDLDPEAMGNWFDFRFYIDHYDEVLGSDGPMHMPEPSIILYAAAGLSTVSLFTLRAKRNRRG